MAEADQPTDSGDDDWVKRALAEAMLGGPATTAPAPLPAEPQPEPAVEASAPEPEPEPSVETPAPEPEQAAPEPITEASSPEAASASRLFERPAFDATNDPGVERMVAEEETSTISVFDDDDDDERSRLRGTIEWLVVLGSAVVVALLLRAFLFQAFYIPSESMEETLRIDDRVLVNKLSYRLHEVHRGDVVVFRRPEEDAGQFRDLIKRVIGLSGETIEARDNTIYINGQVLIEPYLTPGEVIGDFGPVEIPDGELFVMGDNRDNSGDSRVFGTIETERIIGRAFFLFWPFDRVGSL